MDLDRIYERITAAVTTDPTTHKQHTDLVSRIVRDPAHYLNDCYWPGLSLSTLCEVLSDDGLECSEYVAAEAALVWLSRTIAIRANYSDPSRPHTVEPCHVDNRQHAQKVLGCLRIKGLYYFFWNLVLQPWYSRLDARPPPQADLSEAIADDNVDDYFSDTFLSRRTNSFSNQEVTGWQLLSFPPDAALLKQGCYIIQKNCGYCEEPEVVEPEGTLTVRIDNESLKDLKR